MIACYRLRPQYILSKNVVRTLFCDVSKQAPISDAYWKKFAVHNKKSRTKFGHMEYESLRTRDNVRMLHLKHPDMTEVHCGIKVGVGYEDDPDECKGVAHLLEHLIMRKISNESQELFSDPNAHTEDFETVFEFCTTTSENFTEAFRTFWKYLFSGKTLTDRVSQQIIDLEIARLDNEFHENRNTDQYLPIKFVEMLKLMNMNLGKFGAGNRNTLEKIERKELTTHLEKHLQLYCQRPVNVCIQSGPELILKDIFKQFPRKQLDDFLSKKPVESRSTIWKQSIDISSSAVFKQQDVSVTDKLIVMKSDNDISRLIMLYPLHKQMNIADQNTFKFITKMIECELNGHLVDYLRHKSMATGCVTKLFRRTFRITVDLTENGLEKVAEVSFAVRQYLRFLVNKWTEIDGSIYRRHELNKNLLALQYLPNYAAYVANYMDNKSDEFDEVDICKPSAIEEEKHLLTNEIFLNADVVHIILNRRPDWVFQNLSSHYGENFTGGPDTETETIFNIQFHVHTTEMFLEENFNVPKFQLVDMSKYLPREEQSTHYFSGTFITKPTDVVFQELAKRHLSWQSSHIRRIYQKVSPDLRPEMFFSNPSGLSYKGMGTSEELEKDFKDVVYCDLFDNEFLQCREGYMTYLSQMMNNSSDFAMSLLECAVRNNHNTGNSSASPLLYKTLMTLTQEEYNEHFRKLAEIHSIRTEAFNKEFLVKAINENELITVSSLFCETHPLYEDETDYLDKMISDILFKKEVELRLYSCYSVPKTIAGISGIHVEIKSVEQKENQRSPDIRKLCYDMLDSLRDQVAKYGYQPLKDAYIYLSKHCILVQVVGHEKGTSDDTSTNSSVERTFEDV